MRFIEAGPDGKPHVVEKSVLDLSDAKSEMSECIEFMGPALLTHDDFRRILDEYDCIVLPGDITIKKG